MSGLSDALRRLEREVRAAPAPEPAPEPSVTMVPVRDPDTRRILYVDCERSDGTRFRRTPVRDADMYITSVVVEPLPPKPKPAP